MKRSRLQRRLNTIARMFGGGAESPPPDMQNASNYNSIAPPTAGFRYLPYKKPIFITNGDEMQIVSTRQREGVYIEAESAEDLELREYMVFQNKDAAIKALADIWIFLLDNDPDEFKALVGDVNRLVKARNIINAARKDPRAILEWDKPDSYFATWDNVELNITACTQAAEEAIGFRLADAVMYRM